MSFWIIKMAPEKWDADERLAGPRLELLLPVPERGTEIRPGDVIFLWQAGRTQGLRAILLVKATVTTVPLSRENLERRPDAQGRPQIKVWVVQRFARIAGSLLR
jgi:hypothetical protein